MFLVSLVSRLALAQSSALTGVVTDQAGKPVAEVVVIALASDGAGETVVVTDTTGLYRLVLPHGGYVLTFERDSYAQYQRKLVLGGPYQLDVRLEPGPEPLSCPMVPPSSFSLTPFGTLRFEPDPSLVEVVPVVQPNASGVRSIEALAVLAPQVVRDQFGFGFSGAQSVENRYLVDGVSTNDALFGMNRLQLPVEFLEQLSVVTAGVTAEQRASTGGLFSVGTRSGSNEFHGAVWGNATPGALSASPTVIPSDRSMFVTSQRAWNTFDFGADVGGPVVKDKLWFFVGVAPSIARVQSTQSLRRFLIDPAGTDFQYDRAGFIASQPLPGTTQRRFDDTRAMSAIAKLTWYITNDHHLELSFITTPTTATTPFAFNDTHLPWNGGGEQTSNSHLASLHYQGGLLDQHLLLDATVGWFHTDSAYQPNDGSQPGSNDATTAYGAPSIRFTRGSVGDSGPPVSPHSINDLTTLNAEAAAQCELAGTRSTSVVSSRGNARILFACPATGSGNTFTTGGLGAFNNTFANRLQGTASVTWLVQALGHHAVKAGLDVEYVTSTQSQGFSGGGLLTEGALTFTNEFYGARPALEALVSRPTVTTSPSAWFLGGFVQDSWAIADVVTVNAGLRYDTQQLFRSPGVLAVTLNNQLSPRLGVSYDIPQLGRARLFANFAQYTEAVPLSVASVVGGGASVYSVRRRCDPLRDPAPCTDLTPRPTDSFTPFSGDPEHVDPTLRAQTTDELLVGAHSGVFADAVLSASWTRRWMVSVIEDLSNGQGAYFLGNPGFGLGAAYPKAVRDYDAFTASFTKRFGEQWTLQASYTYASLRGNTSGLFRPETGQLAPNTTSDFDQLPYVANRLGPLDADVNHFLKVFAGKDFKITEHLSVSLGVAYLGHSGAPLNYLAAAPGSGNDESFVLPRGSGGRLPFVHEVDAKVGVKFRLDRSTSVALTVDVFNLFNLQAVTSVDQTLSTTNLLPFAAPPGSTPQAAACLSGSNLASCPSDGTLPIKAYDPSTGAIVSANTGQLNADFKRPTGYQAPLTVRVGAKFTF